MSTSSPVLSVRQLAEHWQVSERHVYDLIAQRKLGHLRIGSLIRIRREDVKAYEAVAFRPPVLGDRTTTLLAAVPSLPAIRRLTRGSAFERGQQIARERLVERETKER